MSAPGRIDSLPSLGYANAIFIVGTLGTLITPALLEAWAPLHWGAARLGAVASIELAGLAVGSLSGLWWQRRWPWRPVALVALLTGLVGNGVCVGVHQYAGVCVARLALGLASGLLTALYSAVTANAAAPARVIAVTVFIQIAIEALVLYSSAALFTSLGTGALFAGMAGLFALLLPGLRLLPARWPTGVHAVAARDARPDAVRGGYAILAAFIPFIIVQTGVYTFLGEFGRRAAQLDDATTLHVIGISVLLSALGSVAAFALNERLGLRVPIAAGIAMMTVSLVGMVLGSRSVTAFLAYISLLQISWVFLNCYLYSAIVAVNNLLMPASTPVSTLGSVLGASLMGLVLEYGGLAPSLLLCLGALGVTGLLTLPFLGRVPRAPSADILAGRR